MIRFIPNPQPQDVAPQAIFWRPIRYFTEAPSEKRDNLDSYVSASFACGNMFNYDLRNYRADIKVVVTLYLPLEIRGNREVEEAIDCVASGMLLPKQSVAWRRGQAFEFGRIERPLRDRLREAEARTLVLRLAAGLEGRTASMAQIQRLIPEYFPLSNLDRKPSQTRRGEEIWQQIIRNVVSHQEGTRSLFKRKFAEKVRDGIRVTDAGLNYLKSIGFSA